MNNVGITTAGIANAPTGDTLQSALRKVNTNFDTVGDHIVNLSNPHGVTAAQVGAAPINHVGAGGLAHALATETLAGFMSPTDKNALDQITASGYLTQNQTISLTGDATGSGSTSIAVTLAPSGIVAGTYNSLVVDTKGRAVAGAQAAYLTANQSILVKGDVSGSGSTILTLALTPTGISAGTYTKLVVDASGRAFGGSSLAKQDITSALNFTPIDAATVGVAGGIATIGSNGYLTGSLFPPAISSGMHYVGTWNASSNSPTLTSGNGTAGAIYRVNTAGTYSLDGTGAWYVGDFAVFDGTAWDRWHGAGTEVTSVAGRVGAITLAVTDVSGAAPLASPGFTGSPTAPTPATADNTTSLATTGFVKAQGYLSGNQTLTVSGDATGSGATLIALTLAASGIAAGTYNTLTVDAKGRAISGTNASFLTANQTVAVSGDATGSGATLIALTLAASGVVAGTYNTLVVDTKGRAINGLNVAYLTGNQTITATGDVTGAGATALPLTLVPTGITAGTYNSLVVDAKGRASSGTLVPYLTSNQTVAMTGDATGTGSTAIALTLAASGVTAGTYNTLVVDTKGRATSGSNTAYLTGNQSIAMTGDATGVGATAITLALTPTGVAAGTYSKLTVDLKGRVVAATLLGASDVITALGTMAVALASLASAATVAASAGQFTNPVTMVASGDASGSTSFTGASSFALPLVLASSGVTAGTYNTLVVDAKGRATSGTNTAYLTANQTIAVSGDASGTGSTAVALTLAATGVSAGTYSKLAVDTKGRVLSGALLAAQDVLTALGTYAVPLASQASSASTATVATTAGRFTAPVTMALSGDASGTASFDGSASFTVPVSLAASGVIVGTYNTVVVDAKGRATAGSNAAYLTGNQTISASGDVTGTGSTLIPMTLAASGVTAGSYTHFSVDVKGRVISARSITGADVTTALGYTPVSGVVLSGDVFGSASTGTLIATLSNSGVTAGTYNTLVVDAKGRAITGSNTAYLSSNQVITVSGDAIGYGSTSIILTLSGSGVTAGTYSSVVVDAKGRVIASAQGVSNPVRSYDFNAGSFDAPNSTDWAINMLAPATTDPTNSGLVVRSFDPSTEAGVGMSIRVPQAGVTQVTFRYLVRAATAAASASAAGIVMNCYSRIIPSGASVGSWGTYVMATQSVSTNVYYHEFTETALLSTIGWSLGTVYQLELTRAAAATADTLLAALYMHKIVVEFS